MLLTRITKQPDEILVMETPLDDGRIVLAERSIPQAGAASMRLRDALMKARIDLLHNVGVGSAAAAEAIRTQADLLQRCLSVDPSGAVPWLKFALVDPLLGTERAPLDEAQRDGPGAAPALRTDGPLSVDDFAAHLAALPPRSVIVMVGAGMSVSAGIPDFRTPGTGLYDNLQRYNLPYPEAVFDMNYFPHNPAPFYRLCRELWPGTYTPTPAHRFVTRLHEKGLLLRCFTQNIDSLETAAGLPPSMVVAAHGNFDSAYVVGGPNAHQPVAVDELKAAVMQPGDDGWRALNDKYGGLVKPAITFFGENLPARFTERLRGDFPQCRALIILGTSLKVHPFASLVRIVKSGTPRLLINRERVGEDLGLDFERSIDGTMDGFFQGDCDDGAAKLCRKLGWGETL